MRRIILKLSGEGLAYDDAHGIDPAKVEALAHEIKELFTNNELQLGIIVGGGNIWRGRDAEEFHMDRSSADYMGMLGTILNSLALQNVLESLGCETRVMTSMAIPSLAEPYIYRKALSHMERRRIVIFGGGTGLPFFSTDSTAALRAAELKCDTIFMGKNGVDGVYDSDPRKNGEAKRYSHLTHQELIDRHLQVMDATAAAICSENNIDILVFDVTKPGNINRVFTNPKLGTLITKE